MRSRRMNVMRGSDESGFTLLETMIAMAIMLVAFTSILIAQSSSINSSAKAKQMNIVAMLAKNLMVEAELAFEGKPFDEVKKEEEGSFPDPYAEYKWKREVKEIEFPTLNVGGGGKEGGGEGGDQNSELLTKLMTQFLSKAAREVTVTVTWPRGRGEQSFALTTYWVDLNHEFELNQ
jgi:prepilin-type N-terminal cleavage/methylation domain-containing protein